MSLEGTPAERYSLQTEDVITHVNGVEIHDHDESAAECRQVGPPTPACD